MNALLHEFLNAAATLVDLANRALPPTSRLNWLHLAGTAMLACAVALATGRCDPAHRLRSLAAYLLPRSIWLAPSAILDYKAAVIGKVIERILFAPLVLSSAAVAHAVAMWLGPAGMAPALPPAWVVAMYTVTTVLLADVSFYVVHRIVHRVPLLWEFHKVHHSATVMTPITYLREHPVEQFVQVTVAALFVGPASGAFMHFFPEQLTVLTVLGLNAITFVWFFLLGANLRHSHVWLSFGTVFDRILSSPAQHQIHHSDDPKHFDRNFGSMLAIWDWMFGTLYAPKERPATLKFGLGPGLNEQYLTLADFYLRPFRNAVAILRGVPA
jgi:sterol desaturase/sphingolipid hydroxylase (fatty acid hydroxylase superfamily)